MKKLWQWILDLFRKPDPKPTPQPPVVPVEPPVVVDPTPQSSGNPDALHDPTWGTQGAKTLMGREAGFVNNPANSRGKLKIILPNKYSGTVVRCYVFADGTQDILKRALPNEEPNRQRYYGSHAPGDYPRNLWVRWDTNVNGEAKDYCYCLSDPTKREG